MATELALRFIDNDGSLGHVRGGVLLDGDKIVEYGVYGALARRIVGNVARLARVDEPRAIELIAAEPYGNQGMTLGPASPVARSRRREFELRNHMPGEHEQDDHAGGKARAALKKARAALAETLKLVPGARDDHAYIPGNSEAGDGRYFDWSSSNGEKIAPIRSFEFGDIDEETVSMDLDLSDRQQFATALGVTLARDEAMSNDNPYLASMLLAGVEGGAYFGNSDDIGETGRYIDWSSKGDDGGRRFEVGHDEEDAITFDLSPDEMRALHASLVLSILEDEDR